MMTGGSATPDEGAIDRRRFLGRAARIAWVTPIVYSLMSEHALAQVPTCGSSNQNTPCPNTPTCPPTFPHCCRINSTVTGNQTCGCFTALTKPTLGNPQCNPA